jgi:hypothetical protein
MPIVNSDDCHLCADGKICKIRGDIPKMHEVALPDGRCQIYKPIAEVPQKGPLFLSELDPSPILPKIYFAKCVPRIVEYFMGEALRPCWVVAIRHSRIACLNAGKIGERVDIFLNQC